MGAVPATIVLLHGFTQTGASWDAVRALLPERYRVLAPDIRGHGAAAGVRPITVEAVVGDVLGIAPDRVVLAGYSMGGRLALHVALAAPERLAGLALVGATAGIDDPAQRAERRAADAALADRIAGLGAAAFADEWERTPVLADQPPAVRAAARALRLRQDPAALAQALLGLGPAACSPVWDRLGTVRAPAIVLAGERDARYRELAARLGAALPAAEARVVPGAGHAVHLEAPDAVAAALVDVAG